MTRPLSPRCPAPDTLSLLQPYVFGLTMSCWAAGAITAPIVGGVLAEPCRTWPSLAHSRHCAPGALLSRFPFMLPCIATAVLCMLSFCVGVVALSPSEQVLAAWPLEDTEDEPLFGHEAESPGHDGDENFCHTFALGDGSDRSVRSLLDSSAELSSLLACMHAASVMLCYKQHCCQVWVSSTGAHCRRRTTC